MVFRHFGASVLRCFGGAEGGEGETPDSRSVWIGRDACFTFDWIWLAWLFGEKIFFGL